MDIFFLILGFLVNFTNGLQDLGNSRTEIALLKEIGSSGSSGAAKAVKKLEAKENRRFWHRWGFITYGLMGIIFGLYKYESGIIYATYFVFIFYLLRPLVFNPILGLGLVENGGFFHLSDEGGEGWIKKKIGGKAYWFICLAFMNALLALYFLKIDFG